MCPYDTWQRGTFLFCEADRCGWIRQPINTVSNAGFLIVGFWLLKRYRRVPQVRVIGVAALFVGVLSAFYHATSSYVGEVLDLGSMYLLVGGIVAFNLQRLDVMGVKASEVWAAAISLVGMIALFFIRGPGGVIFDVMILAAISLELIWYLRNRARVDLPSYTYFWSALGCYAIALTIWWLDSAKIVCFPESLWFQGHAVWHWLGALNFFFLARYYSQFSTKPA